MISQFELWLRSRTSKEKRPFHEETILANVSPEPNYKIADSDRLPRPVRAAGGGADVPLAARAGRTG